MFLDNVLVAFIASLFKSCLKQDKNYGMFDYGVSLKSAWMKAFLSFTKT